MCYRIRLWINKFNARGSGYELERRFSKFIAITQAITPFNFIQGHRFQYQSKAHYYIYDLLVINRNMSSRSLKAVRKGESISIRQGCQVDIHIITDGTV